MAEDVDRYRRQPGDQLGETKPKTRLPARGKKYFRGPVPLSWLSLAAKLSGRTLHVGLAVWHVAHLTKDGSEVVLSRSACSAFGVERQTMRRALARLEAAGLVRVAYHHGRSPRVTILDVGESKE